MALIKTIIKKLKDFLEVQESEMEKWRKEDPEVWVYFYVSQSIFGGGL